MGHVKSSYEIALEKMERMGIQADTLTDAQKARAADIRREYESRIAERQILLAGEPELAEEIRKLEQERYRLLQELRGDSRPA